LVAPAQRQAQLTSELVRERRARQQEASTWPLRGCLLLRLEQQLLGQEHLEVSGLRLQRLALL